MWYNRFSTVLACSVFKLDPSGMTVPETSPKWLGFWLRHDPGIKFEHATEVVMKTYNSSSLIAIWTPSCMLPEKREIQLPVKSRFKTLSYVWIQELLLYAWTQKFNIPVPVTIDLVRLVRFGKGSCFLCVKPPWGWLSSTTPSILDWCCAGDRNNIRIPSDRYGQLHVKVKTSYRPS